MKNKYCRFCFFCKKCYICTVKPIKIIFVMKRYFANYKVNNGTTMIRPIESTNKFKLWKDIKDIAKGEMFPGSICHCWVSDETERVVLSGMFDESRRFHVLPEI